MLSGGEAKIYFNISITVCMLSSPEYGSYAEKACLAEQLTDDAEQVGLDI